MPEGTNETKKAKADLAAAKAKDKALRPWYQKKRFMIPIGLVVLSSLVNSLNGDDTGPDPLATPETSQTSSSESSEATSPETSEPAQDITTIEGLKSAISSLLGEETNMDIPRNLDVTLSEGDLYVMYALNENFTSDLMIGGAWSEVSDVVKLVQESGLSNNLTVNGTLALIDVNGNELGQQIVFTANFLDGKVPLLNTENLLGREMWENAASFYIYHPALRD
jgi:hypothetical protein